MSRPTTLPAWLAYLETLHPKAIAMGLDRVRAVHARMGTALACPVVTVTGTNGKGSTCAMLEAIYRAAGFRVGLYASPHLARYNERIRIDAHDATDAAILAALDAVEDARTAPGAAAPRRRSPISSSARSLPCGCSRGRDSTSSSSKWDWAGASTP